MTLRRAWVLHSKLMSVSCFLVDWKHFAVFSHHSIFIRCKHSAESVPLLSFLGWQVPAEIEERILARLELFWRYSPTIHLLHVFFGFHSIGRCGKERERSTEKATQNRVGENNRPKKHFSVSSSLSSVVSLTPPRCKTASLSSSLETASCNRVKDQ